MIASNLLFELNVNLFPADHEDIGDDYDDDDDNSNDDDYYYYGGVGGSDDGDDDDEMEICVEIK